MRSGRRRYPGNGPWSDVPPYQRPGRGAGYGGRYGFTGTTPTKCARFPERPRGWWRNPDITTSIDSEKEFLEGQINTISQELEILKKKLSELPPKETQ